MLTGRGRLTKNHGDFRSRHPPFEVLGIRREFNLEPGLQSVGRQEQLHTVGRDRDHAVVDGSQIADSPRRVGVCPLDARHQRRRNTTVGDPQ